jgi:hypothetical protein
MGPPYYSLILVATEMPVRNGAKVGHTKKLGISWPFQLISAAWSIVQ